MKRAVLTVMTMTAMLAGGCCEIKTIYVPVSSCPAPKEYAIPTLLVDNLTPTATTQDKLQAIKVDYGTMRKSMEQCKTLLDGYRTPPKVEPKN